jgi:hypothetical protein
MLGTFSKIAGMVMIVRGIRVNKLVINIMVNMFILFIRDTIINFMVIVIIIVSMVYSLYSQNLKIYLTNYNIILKLEKIK